jgi:YfiH family protein
MSVAVPIRCGRLGALPRIAHGFFTRQGGVSGGLYSSLNVGIGSGDAPEAVMENRRRVAAALGGSGPAMATPHQVHSPDTVIVEAPFDLKDRPQADAVVTATPGVILGVLTADCGPVLFADPHARVIGAAHAGWKGALTGVLESAIAAMESLGAKRGRILATLGPSIRQENYEVGPEFVARFEEQDAQNRRFFRPSQRSGHAMFDMTGYILARLAAAGVDAAASGECTYADEERFFSFRRATHRREADYGRQISAITIGS